MAQTIDDLAVVLSASTGQLGSDLRVAAKMFADFQKRVEAENGGKSTSKAAKDAQKEAAAHRRAAKEAAAASKAAGETGSVSFMKLTGAALAANVAMLAVKATGLGVADVVGQIGDSVRMAADAERTAISFEVMLNSASQAASLMADIRRYAVETPFGSAETTDAARQLLAYGSAAEEIIPTLRMLGNIAAPIADTTSLKELVYLYGTLQTQGRAYAQDIRQFSGRGIPIIAALAKEMGVAKDEVHNLVEEGRVGFPQVARALESLQLRGGPFAGMMAKQSQSLHGLVEQARDSFDRLKLSLGQIIIEETGLKAVVKDLEHFGDALAKGIDTQGLRQGIRLAADFAKGVAHVGYEFGKAGMQSGAIFGEMASELPMIKDTLNQVRALIRDMNEFKLDPADVARVAVSLSKDLLGLGGAMAALVAELGESFVNNVLNPIADLMRDIRGTKETVENRMAVASAVWEIVKPANQIKQAGKQLGVWADDARPANNPNAEAPAGNNPANDAFASMKRFSESLKKLSESMDRTGDMIIARLNAQKEAARLAAAAEDFAQHTKQLEAKKEFLRAYMGGAVGPIAGMVPGDPLAGIAAALPAFKKGFDKSNAFTAIGGGMMGVARSGDLGEPRLPIGDALDPNLLAMARGIKDDFNPLVKLKREREDMQKLLDAGKLTKPEMDFAWMKKVQGVADGLGIGGPTQLPEAAFRGTSEATRIINQVNAGMGASPVETLLKLIEEHTRQMKMSNENIDRKVEPVENVKIGQGG